ncbi:GTPase HflX [Ferrovum myxofaciens]|jgi:GTP-binding protein HflX|uniref:GTPase HflX n=2 Tax=root TaxID=1 RepID=A0A8F3IHX8_9PROT|nr:GTPase HflX [Ferrovum myxofaciens]KXW58020.1 GTPase HflX [Ferrovum myxofaciens]MBU6993629.1 GTPase HflX [Ferrovum myxofaciens]QKE37563.1 MAG: GTPase HflX [Ferrovum myxofaciens]QKE40118.1 MAG: GTPase HflX [Ferrovum myxofaciens]QWY75216.1 MAG: GTPase HflX [Ferrovum myxofaciens]
MQTEVKGKAAFAVVAAVQLPGVSDIEFEASLAELRDLSKTLGYKVVRTFTQKRTAFDTSAYLGLGKRVEIRDFINGSEVPDSSIGTIDRVFVDHEISPSQARNLENDVGCDVMDRTMVIFSIFHRNARSRAAKAQVEIARLGYMAPRLREMAKLAGPQGRQRSGTGGRGAGESHTELDKRRIRDRIAELQQEIAAMDVERKTQRSRRQERQGLASVALVGYTNAGKSTLMRALTGSEVLVENKLFATLDTTVRTLYPESVPHVLVSDTVGFIKNLPHGLVASFKSTLEEALDASLLLHVIDASDPGFERQLEVTDKVLAEISAETVPRIRVFNKVDQVGDAVIQTEFEIMLRAQYPDCIVMSARRIDDVATLHKAIVAFFRKDLIEAELFLPWSAQKLRGEIFSSCEVLEERADIEGAFLRVRGTRGVLEKYTGL